MTCLPSHREEMTLQQQLAIYMFAAVSSSRLCKNKSCTHANRTQIKTPLEICLQSCGQKCLFQLSNWRNVYNAASAKQRRDMRWTKWQKPGSSSCLCECLTAQEEKRLCIIAEISCLTVEKKKGKKLKLHHFDSPIQQSPHGYKKY